MKDKHMLCVFCISAAEDYKTRDDLFPDMPELLAKTLFHACCLGFVMDLLIGLGNGLAVQNMILYSIFLDRFYSNIFMMINKTS